MDFPDKWAAIVWMCRNQLGRRNITDEQRTVLIGEAYKAQKMSVGAPEGNKNAEKQCAQNEHIVSSAKRTSEIIANEFGVGRETVKRAEHYVDGLNAAEKVSPGIKDAVLSGAVKAPKRMIAEIRNAPEEKRAEAVKAKGRGVIPGLFCWIDAQTQGLPAPLRLSDHRPLHKCLQGLSCGFCGLCGGFPGLSRDG